MAKKIDLSKPVELQTPNREVHEFTHLSGKRVVFLSEPGLFKSAAERERCFYTVWQEKGKTLRDHAVVEIKGRPVVTASATEFKPTEIQWEEVDLQEEQLQKLLTELWSEKRKWYGTEAILDKKEIKDRNLTTQSPYTYSDPKKYKAGKWIKGLEKLPEGRCRERGMFRVDDDGKETSSPGQLLTQAFYEKVRDEEAREKLKDSRFTWCAGSDAAAKEILTACGYRFGENAADDNFVKGVTSDLLATWYRKWGKYQRDVTLHGDDQGRAKRGCLIQGLAREASADGVVAKLLELMPRDDSGSCKRTTDVKQRKELIRHVLRDCGYSFGKFSFVDGDMIESVDHLLEKAEQWFEHRTIGTRAHQEFEDVKASTERSKFTYEIKDAPGDVKTDVTMKAPQFAFKVHALALDSFKEQAASSNSIIAFFVALYDFFTSPLVRLYHLIFADADVQELVGSFDTIDHEHVGNQNYSTFLAQIRFVSNLLGRVKSEGGKSAREVFTSAYQMGRSIADAQATDKLDQRNKVIEGICKRFTKFVTGEKENKHEILPEQMIIPVGIGEGKEYTTHLLIFEMRGERLFLKNLSLLPPTMDKGKFQVVTTYDVTELAGNAELRGQLIHAIVSLQAFDDKAHVKEKEEIGPKVKDETLDTLLLDYGAIIEERNPVEQKGSRDPVKALCAALQQVVVERNREKAAFNKEVPVFDTALADVISSKSRFYQAYVNELISFIESNEAKLSASQKVRLLESLQWYIGKVKHYMEKEVGLDAALAVTERLTEFVEKKLPNEERIAEAEKQDDVRLGTKATLFSSKIDCDFDEALQARSVTVLEDSSRVSTECWEKVEQLKQSVSKPNPTPVQRGQVLTGVNGLKGQVQLLLNNGETKAAKALSYAILHSLPPAMNKADGEINFWDSLETKEEIAKWTEMLFGLSEQMWQATMRSGTFPLAPHEAFEFNVVVPLTLRRLFALGLPHYEKEFRDALVDVQGKPEVIARLDQARKGFVEWRKAELKKAVEKRLKEEWKAEDEDHKQRLRGHQEDVNYHQLRRVERQKHWKDKGKTGLQIAAKLATWDADNHVPLLDPPIPTAAEKKVARKIQRVEEIEKAWREDGFLNDLKDIDLAQMPTEWEGMFTRSGEHTDWMRAVRGRFAQIMGISKELYASAYSAQNEGAGLSGRGKEIDSWMMRPDLSLVIGVNPEQDDRFEACRRMYDTVPNKAENEVKVEVSQMAVELSCFIIGYDQLGNGLYFTGVGSYTKERELKKTVERKLDGYFKDKRDGAAHLAPHALTLAKRMQVMNRVMDHPDAVGYYHAGGILGEAGIGAVATPARYLASGLGALGDGEIKPEEVKKDLAQMKDVHMTFGQTGFSKTPVFAISERSAAYPAKYYVDEEKEVATDSSPRAAFFGQASQSMVRAQVVRDSERRVLNDVDEHKQTDLNLAQEFLLKATNVGCSEAQPPRQPSFWGGGDVVRDQTHDHLASYLSVSESWCCIYQYPQLLADESVRDKLYHSMFQRGLVREHLKAYPQFFVDFGPFMSQIIEHRAKAGDHAGELFVMEVAERIRAQAIAEKIPLANAISEALPKYDKALIETWYRDKAGTSEQKLFATFLVNYYVSYPPQNDDLESWKGLLEAFSLIHRSPIETGHTGLQSALTQAVQEQLLPRIYSYIKDNQSQRNELLQMLSGRAGSWEIDPRLEYGFKMTTGDGLVLSVDLRTGKGFATRVEFGERDLLPTLVRQGEGDFEFLFGKSFNPLVDKKHPVDGVTEYSWTDRETGITYSVFYNDEEKSYQIQQETEKGNRYQFQRVGIDTSVLSKVFGHHNKTVEQYIHKKGVWIKLDSNMQKDLQHVYVPRHGNAVENDSIRLYIKNNKILGATLGEGARRKWVCSGLSKSDTQLFSFRASTNLILLSADRKHVDEVRFPDGLTLVRSRKDHKKWVVSGREDVEWQLHGTEELERRFGKNYREFLLPLKNQRTGEEEYWIYPYMATSLEKKGSEIKLIKTVEDAVRLLKSLAGDVLELEEEGEEALARGLPLLGIAESFLGTEGLMDGVGGLLGGSPELSALGLDVKEMLVPSPTKYVIDSVKGESGSHQGFLYLSSLAALRGDWGMASHYLTQMVENGSTKLEDIPKLEAFVKKQLGLEVLGQLKELKELRENLREGELPKVDSARKTAYRLKLLLSIAQMRKLLEAQHKKPLSLFDMKLTEGGDAAPGVPTDVIDTAIGFFASDYRMWIKERGQELKEQGLLLTRAEESTLQEVAGRTMPGMLSIDLREIAKIALESSAEEESVDAGLMPFHFPIPTQVEMDAFVEQMVKSINSNPPKSISQLHRAKGSAPKWGTIGANFWTYWEWIVNNEPTVEDLAFLLHPIPKGEKYLAATETARRLLLMVFQHKYTQTNSVTSDTWVRMAQGLQKKLPNITAMEERSARYKKEAEKRIEGQGRWRSAISAGWRNGKSLLYDQYVEWKKAAYLTPVETQVGGVAQQRGPGADFKKGSQDILKYFIGECFAPHRANGLEIRAKEQPGVGDHNLLSAQPAVVKPIPDISGVTQPPKPPSTEQKLKEEMWTGHVGPLLAMAGGFLGGEGAKSLSLLKQFFFSQLDSEESTDALLELLPKELTESLPPMILPVVKAAITAAREDYQGRLPTASQFARQRAKEVAAAETAFAWKPIAIRPSAKGPEVWQAYFKAETKEKPSTTVNLGALSADENAAADPKTTVWDDRKATVDSYFPKVPGSPMEDAANDKIRRGVQSAVEELKEKAQNSLSVAKVGALRQELDSRLKELAEEESALREEILAFSRSYADALEIRHLYADTGRTTPSQIFELVIDRYQKGKLGRIGSEAVQSALEEMVTRFLLAATERQQLSKARQIVSAMLKERGVLHAATFCAVRRFLLREEFSKLQAAADRSVTWLLNSHDLFAALSEGANRLRYADDKGNLSDPQLSRKYLATEYRRKWITRLKAKDAVEGMLDRGERFVKVRMGIGKSTFIFPLITRLAIERGKEPVLVTTEALLSQLQGFVDHKAFIFHFDINYGLPPLPKEKDETDAEYNDRVEQRIDKYIDTLLFTLTTLKKEGRYVLTTPGRLAFLRNKRVELQDQLSSMKAGPERTHLFKLLQKLKKIEGYFKGEGIVYFQDEDVNLDISFEYNNAIGKPRRADPVRYNMAEKLVDTFLKDPEFSRMLLDNTIRTISDPRAAMKTFAHQLYRDTDFWVSKNIGWTKEAWEAIDEDEFVDFVLGARKMRPRGMPAWDMDRPEQEPLCYVGALKTLLSRTFPAVYHVHADLGRGFRKGNGCAVDPYLDGFAKPNTQYGEEFELILHHFFHYLRQPIEEKLFLKMVKELSPRKEPISDLSPVKWVDWYAKIVQFADSHYYERSESDPEPRKLSKYEAFSHPKMFKERVQLLRYIMLESGYVKIFTEQIVCNSQDVTLDAQVHVGSGTGDPFAMNLADPEHDASADPDLITGETLLCVGDPMKGNGLDTVGDPVKGNGLDTLVARFTDPLDFMIEKASDLHCRAIINQGYEVRGNRMKKLAESIRHSKGAQARQLVFRDSATHDKLIWNAGGEFSPEPYTEEDVDARGSLFLYGPADTRGVDFQIPVSPDNYGVLLVDINTNRDDFEQALWRMRQLGSGQRGEIAIDRKLADRVVKNYNRNRKPAEHITIEQITIGHVFNNLKLRSLKEDELRHTKAAAFRARTPLKLHLDKVEAKPFDLESVGDDTRSLEECEQELFKICRSLYIVNSDIKWAHELEPANKVKAIAFLRDLYMGQLRRMVTIREELAVYVRKIATPPTDGTPMPAELPLFYRYYNGLLPTAEQISSSGLSKGQISALAQVGGRIFEIREALKKIGLSIAAELGTHDKEVREALEKVEISIKPEEAQSGKLDESLTKDFLTRNLPTEVESSIDDVSKNEQQVEQQVEQEAEQEVEQENVELTGHSFSDCDPLNYSSFLRGRQDGTYSRISDLSRRGRSYGYRGYYSEAARREELLDGMFVSERAKDLLASLTPGQPVVHLLVVQDKRTGICRSCLVTKTDLEQTIAPALRAERESGGVSGNNVALYALSHQEFKGRLLMNRGETLPTKDSDVKRHEFLWKIAVTKLYVGWTKLTNHEKRELEYRMRGDRRTFEKLVSWLKSQQDPGKSVEFLAALREEMYERQPLSTAEKLKLKTEMWDEHIAPKIPNRGYIRGNQVLKLSCSLEPTIFSLLDSDDDETLTSIEKALDRRFAEMGFESNYLMLSQVLAPCVETARAEYKACLPKKKD